MRRILTATLLLCMFAVGLCAQTGGCKNVCPIVHIVPERLPDMTMPRSGHNAFYVNGELTVVGGHTTNFVTTPTAEYLADGQWHPMTMAYPHDNGFAVVLRSGEVIIGGGHSEPLGVGQTYLLERYTAATHTFEGFGCLDCRRVLANATQLADGRVIISGNHYADDAIGCYDGRSQVEHVRSVVQPRSNPYILPTADDNALIVGGNDQYDRQPDSVWVDRVKGDAFRVPLLERWHPVYTDQPFSSSGCSIGGHTYLLTATDRNGQLGIVVVRDTVFSLLPTACPIPMETSYGTVFYKGPVAVDRQRQRGYVIGVDSLYRRQYVLAIDYAQEPAALTLYYTDTLEQANITIPVVTPDGNLLLAGGHPNDNYKPLSSVWLYHFGTTAPTAGSATWPGWLCMVAIVAVIAALAYLLVLRRRRRRLPVSKSSTGSADDEASAMPDHEALTASIFQLIEQDQRYLTPRLKLSDIANELGVSVATVAECIKTSRQCNFTELIAECRVRHAQRLITEHPGMKVAAIIEQSGFTSESTFFRTFKAVTGLSPKEWLAQQTGNTDAD